MFIFLGRFSKMTGFHSFLIAPSPPLNPEILSVLQHAKLQDINIYVGWYMDS